MCVCVREQNTFSFLTRMLGILQNDNSKKTTTFDFHFNILCSHVQCWNDKMLFTGNSWISFHFLFLEVCRLFYWLFISQVSHWIFLLDDHSSIILSSSGSFCVSVSLVVAVTCGCIWGCKRSLDFFFPLPNELSFPDLPLLHPCVLDLRWFPQLSYVCDFHICLAQFPSLIYFSHFSELAWAVFFCFVSVTGQHVSL